MVAVKIHMTQRGLNEAKTTINKHAKFNENPPSRELWNQIFHYIARMYERRFSMASHMQKTRQFHPYRAGYGVNTGQFKRSLTQVSGALGGIRVKRKWIAYFGMRLFQGSLVSGGVPTVTNRLVNKYRSIPMRTRTATSRSRMLAWYSAPGVKHVAFQTRDKRPPKPIKPARILLIDKALTAMESRKLNMSIDRVVRKHLGNIK